MNRHKLQDFQAFLYANIPLVGHMQLELKAMQHDLLTASAPLLPNINDKSTVFGGSSATLMTICGWSLIKYHLEDLKIHHDVVIHKSQLNWIKAQKDDLIIHSMPCHEVNWQQLSQELKTNNKSIKLLLSSQVLNQANEICSTMDATYVILKK